MRALECALQGFERVSEKAPGGRDNYERNTASPVSQTMLTGTPLIMVLYKSSSRGKLPVGVERNLNIPFRKSRGQG